MQFLVLQWPYLKVFKERNGEQFDHRHRANDLPEIPDNTEVWITSEDKPISGRVVGAEETSRSYIVETDSGLLQRNKSQHLRKMLLLRCTSRLQNCSNNKPGPPGRIMTSSRTSRTGTSIYQSTREAACRLKGGMWLELTVTIP